MQLISSIKIECFRSIRSASLVKSGDFTSFAGLNNSGKSNILRALNLFFTGETEPGVKLRIDSDYIRHDLRKKKRKRIRIAISFNLPASFKFRSELRSTEQYLNSRHFIVAKEWTRESPVPAYFLNDKKVEDADRLKIDQFLNLISFRYIPNRVLPLDIIRNEYQALRDVLVRRLAKKAKDKSAVFDDIRETSAQLIGNLAGNVQKACPEVNTLRLATPTNWQDMIFAFGYKLDIGGVEIEDSAQGSGLQSWLMLQTLSLIDRDYFQQFGWKQAAIWAIEEPESSMHSSLEARVGAYLSEVATAKTGRLQVFATTHSDLMLQFSDETAFVTTSNDATEIQTQDKKLVLENAAAAGISRWVHPILKFPLSTLVLVEGKFDCDFLESALKLTRCNKDIQISYVARLAPGKASGGVDELLAYIKNNIQALKTRISSAPVVVLLDWDSSNKKAEFERLLQGSSSYSVLVWQESECNPELDLTFRGIERFYSTRLITQADVGSDHVGTKQSGQRTIGPRNYEHLKPAINSLVLSDLRSSDLAFANNMINRIVSKCP